MKRVLRYTILYSITALLTLSCKSDLTSEQALSALQNLPEFNAPFYAPFHVGREVLSGDNHKRADEYIREHMGELLKSGVVQVKTLESNSWRTVIEVSLSEQGKALSDPSRATEEKLYVQVCRVKPIEVTQLKATGESGDTIMVDYTFAESEITPFGKHLEFVDARQHTDTRRFVRSGMSWEVVD